MVKDEKEIPIANISGEIVSGSVYISALASARPGSNMIYSMENKRGFFFIFDVILISLYRVLFIT